ncbi:glycoside hydrolase family 15 [Phytoactinopolyspora alkaliphila]|uniref:Glycoside hydrolase family 15 n=1 Tax=Phytoactinopolyspora alkaliphila TaxID=1783498 RepID=A0A6N9YR31_9ACTN|nr:glycoside hydrolase family 15 protein [Phytoactinopolyspora alkaliphila]NED97288.1 glycoside hydrolase family 15 [Phytoactinopolyspora alkaliphila]
MTTTPTSPALDPADTAALADLAHRSHQVITQYQHPSGAYPASPTFSAYRGFAWFRDGSFTAEGISRYGDVESANRFHDWASTVLTDRADDVARLVAAAAAGEDVPVERMLPTRFTLEGADGTADWWDFQTDGYGMWLWAVTTHAGRHGMDLARWTTGIRVCVAYVAAFWDRPCYDWWEENLEHRHVSTLGAIYGGLAAVAESGVLDADGAAKARQVAGEIRKLVREEGVHGGHLTKWLGSEVVDGSLPACVVPFGLVEAGDPIAGATLDAVARDLDVDGGVHRFRADVFYGGGQWLLLSALLGWNRAVTGDTDAAWRYLRWMVSHTTSGGDMPEQVPDHLLAPEHRDEWLERWGPVATPLLWSHGMYLILADELGIFRGTRDRRDGGQLR